MSSLQTELGGAAGEVYRRKDRLSTGRAKKDRPVRPVDLENDREPVTVGDHGAHRRRRDSPFLSWTDGEGRSGQGEGAVINAIVA